MKIKFVNCRGQICEVTVTKEWLEEMEMHYAEVKDLFAKRGVTSFMGYVKAVLSFNCC